MEDINTTDAHKNSETEAACTGPAGSAADGVPEMMREVDTAPIPKPEALFK